MILFSISRCKFRANCVIFMTNIFIVSIHIYVKITKNIRFFCICVNRRNVLFRISRKLAISKIKELAIGKIKEIIFDFFRKVLFWDIIYITFEITSNSSTAFGSVLTKWVSNRRADSSSLDLKSPITVALLELVIYRSSSNHGRRLLILR